MDRLELRTLLADLERLRHGIKSPLEALSPDPMIPSFPRWADRFLARLHRALAAQNGSDLHCYRVRWDAKGRWAVDSPGGGSFLAGNEGCGSGSDSGSRDFLAMDLVGATRYAQARARQFQADLVSLARFQDQDDLTHGDRVAVEFSHSENALLDGSIPSPDGLTDGEIIAARFLQSQEAVPLVASPPNHPGSYDEPGSGEGAHTTGGDPLQRAPGGRVLPWARR